MGKTSLRIMSMNLENLFSPGEEFYGSHYSPAEYEAKVNWIASMIAKGQVHVAALTELGEDSESCIGDVMKVANEKDTTTWDPFEHEFRAQPSKGSTKIRTAVISRFELTNTQSITRYPEGFRVDLHKPGTSFDEVENWVTVPSTQFSRPVAKVRVNPENGTPFNLFVVHLKSKRPIKVEHDGLNEAIGIARAAVQRNVEAAALRYYFDTFLPTQYEVDRDVPTFIVGDFNDTPTSVPIENIRGPFDKVPGPASPWSGVDKRRLISCARLHLKKSAYEDRLFSYVHNESFSLLDQVFVTEHLPGRFVRFEVYNDHVLRHQDLSSPTEQEKQWKSMVSDHGVIVVEFKRMLKA
ncbi:MAG: endonuclease/exonuclease/phosphatase family protein [Anaerolineae bacterium]